MRRVVVRRHGAAAWKELEENTTSAEFALLKALEGAGMRVPAPLLLDRTGMLLPSPYLVMAFVEGSTAIDEASLSDALRETAVYLARLHALDVNRLELPPLPRGDDPIAGALRYLPATSATAPLRAALSERRVGRRPNPLALLHGDYWPGNIIWSDGRIAAVIDWEDASVGDPLSDLAGCRVELLWRHGEAAMETFTSHYRSLAEVDLTDLPFWELYASSAGVATVAEWGLDPIVEARMRQRTTEFMERAGRAVLSQCT